jgi:hypothetical protein
MRRFLVRLLLGRQVEAAMMHVQEARTCAEALIFESPALPIHNWSPDEIEADMNEHFGQAEKILRGWM